MKLRADLLKMERDSKARDLRICLLTLALAVAALAGVRVADLPPLIGAARAESNARP